MHIWLIILGYGHYIEILGYETVSMDLRKWPCFMSAINAVTH
jgi:hypothetical protein